MTRVLQALFRRMVVKIFAALGLVVGGTLLFLAWRQSDAEIAALKNETRESAQKIADAMLGSIEHSMLQGNGVEVTGLVHSVRQRVPDSHIHIYDSRGVEVFGAKPPPPAPATLPADLRAALADGQRRVAGPRILRPIPNEARCRECHPGTASLRGVLELDALAGPARRSETLATLVQDAFIRVMTAEQKDLLDGYFAELTKVTPSIAGVAVYDAEGDLSFGAPIANLPGDALKAALVPGAPRTSLAIERGKLVLVPLPMEERCRQCHDDDLRVRGVMAVAVSDLAADASAATELEEVVDTSLRVIMMSSLGRMITGFLDTVVATGAASKLTLHDEVGRRYYTTAPATPPPHVGASLAANRGSWSVLGHGADERVEIVQPLANDKRCHRCHGSHDTMRGAATVSIPTGHAAEVRERARTRAVLFMGFALAAILALLYVLLGYLVIKPVRQIGDVAEAVGAGNLDVAVRRAAADGDEVSRLGHRINHMIEGLRTEQHMRRFVSKGTAAAARGAARDPTASNTALQMRRPSTVLFTDIRGFTAYSETVSPERVVEMLNRLLQAQADVVERYHGDIDKYVGDELMAVFEGKDATARAVACAVEMVEAVEALRTETEPMRVGAGLSCGEMVHGPIGSQNRQDFTVIGDVVNIGARLCSAAGPGEVIVSQAVRDACGSIESLVFEPMEPLQLKGKREPFAVYRVRRA